ncbi:hypothetical protein [Novosphingobium sp.]|uniref:hypothetical protein n=1 Tax=Novosphingobium sp. TaxID=1874826 RepID=UPI0035B0770E
MDQGQMEQERSSQARARIEAALRRIEAAAKTAAERPGAAELQRLQARHDRLRAAVQDSLGQLDLLIEGGQA